MVVLGSSPSHSRAGGAIYVVLLCLGYVLFYGWLLWNSDGFPYVMDNNESFSSLWHATNLFHQDLSRSFGLTDEAYGFNSAAHPYVYTHQGNFPRLFALLLYAAGARSIESQIVITTFTVGLASMLLAFTVLSRIGSNRGFAALACAIMFTDYVLVAQWQVVTYRVWHAFFVFSTFFCVLELEKRRNVATVTLVLANAAFLFYFELVFAAFTAAAAGLFALTRNWRRPGAALITCMTLGVGGAFAVSVLCAQIVLYMGWDNFVKDALYTFVARNQFADSETMVLTLRQFYESNHIVFWYNLFDGASYRTFSHFVASLTFYEWQIQTPVLAFALALPGVGWLAALTGTFIGTALDEGARGRRRRSARTFHLALLWMPHAFVALHLLHLAWRGWFATAQAWALAAIALLVVAAWRRSRRLHDWRLNVAATGSAVLLGGLLSLIGYAHSTTLIFGNIAPAVAVLAGGFLIVAIINAYSIVELLEQSAEGERRFRTGVSLDALVDAAFLASTFAVLLVALFSPFGMGLRPDAGMLSMAWIRATDVLAAAAVAAMIYVLLRRSRSHGAHDRGPDGAARMRARIFNAIVVNSIAALALLGSTLPFNAKYQPLWDAAVNHGLPVPWPRVLVVLALVLAHGAAQIDPVRIRDAVRVTLGPIAMFVLAGYVSYAVIFVLSPGYVFTGYRFRLAPLTAFFTDVVVAGAIYLAWRIGCELATRLGSRVPRSWGAAVGGAFLLYWANLQLGYLSLMPADQFGILKTLSEPPFRGASFASNTYAAPVAAFTGHWAYIDQELAQAKPVWQDGMWRLETDDRYVWLADRDRNIAYRHPRYFICLMPQSMPSALAKIAFKKTGMSAQKGCSQMGLVRYSRTRVQVAVPRARLVAIDDRGRAKYGHETWAIVELDWTTR